jgi:hypothetical protein
MTMLYGRPIGAIAHATSARRASLYARLMLILALGGGLVQMALGRGLLDRFGNVLGGDFLAFYTGASLFVQGRISELYDFAAQAEFQRAVAQPHPPADLYLFVSPPSALPLLAPFGFWSYPVALLLWWATGLIALGLSAHLLRSELPALRRYSELRLTAASFLFFPTVAWLLYGQATALILLVYTGTFVLLRQGRDFSAGLCLGCLAFKPQLAVVLALLLAFKRRWKALCGGALCAAAWLAAGLAFSPDALTEYATLAPELPELLRSEHYPRWGIHSAFGFSVLLFDAISPHIADASALLLSLGLVALLGYHWHPVSWTPGSRRWDLAMAATLALGLIISPHLFLYDLALLLLPFAILWHHHPGSSDGRLLDGGPLLAWTAVLWLVSFLQGPVSIGALRLAEWAHMPAMALQLSTLVIVAWALALLRAAREGDTRFAVGGER